MLMKREDMAAVAVDYQERLMRLCSKEELLAHSESDSPEWTKRTWNSDLYARQYTEDLE